MGTLEILGDIVELMLKAIGDERAVVRQPAR
jgi:hypothetical protein